MQEFLLTHGDIMCITIGCFFCREKIKDTKEDKIVNSKEILDEFWAEGDKTGEGNILIVSFIKYSPNIKYLLNIARFPSRVFIFPLDRCSTHEVAPYFAVLRCASLD